MALDPQAVTIAVGSISAAVAAIITGFISGRNTRHKDQLDAEIALDQARFAREKAEADASKLRIEAIVADNTDLRMRLRASEQDFDKQLRELRDYARDGWDLANQHFQTCSIIAHQLNNIFQVSMNNPDSKFVSAMVANAQQRMKVIHIPLSVDDARTDELNPQPKQENPP